MSKTPESSQDIIMVIGLHHVINVMVSEYQSAQLQTGVHYTRGCRESSLRA